jgi:DNA-binding transcriptional regulator YdaS (Cro superfamily)
MNLAEWIEFTGVRRTTFAKKVGISPSHLNLLCNGSTLPSIPVALGIEEETNGAVTLKDWRSVDWRRK